MLYPEIVHTVTDDFGLATGNDGHFDGAIQQHADAVAIQRIEGFVFLTAIVELQTTVGQHAIDVQDQQANPARAFGASGHLMLLYDTGS